MRRVTLGLGAVLLLAGCGGSTGSTGSATTSPAATPGGTSSSSSDGTSSPGGTQLTAVVDPDGTGRTVVVTLTCDPPGGDVADPEAACAQVAAVGAAGFAPTDPDAVCTQQYDGPQTASVTGTVDGEQVDADLSRTDGCAISRWDALSALLPTGR